eukprot:1389578-Prymnesium_polylepis.1
MPIEDAGLILRHVVAIRSCSPIIEEVRVVGTASGPNLFRRLFGLLRLLVAQAQHTLSRARRQTQVLQVPTATVSRAIEWLPPVTVDPSKVAGCSGNTPNCCGVGTCCRRAVKPELDELGCSTASVGSRRRGEQPRVPTAAQTLVLVHTPRARGGIPPVRLRALSRRRRPMGDANPDDLTPSEFRKRMGFEGAPVGLLASSCVFSSSSAWLLRTERTQCDKECANVGVCTYDGRPSCCRTEISMVYARFRCVAPRLAIWSHTRCHQRDGMKMTSPGCVDAVHTASSATRGYRFRSTESSLSEEVLTKASSLWSMYSPRLSSGATIKKLLWPESCVRITLFISKCRRLI